MDLRELFRLTKTKFIIFLILVVIITQTASYIGFFFGGPSYFHNSIWKILISPIWYLSGYLTLTSICPGFIFTCFIPVFWNGIVYAIGTFLDLVIYYGIACLISRIFSRVKKTKHI